jgi:hypothetical protein
MFCRITETAGRAGAAVVKLRPAAALGTALLIIGLVIGLLIAPRRVEVVSSPAPAAQIPLPSLSWRDDYGTRHHLTPAKDPVLGWHDSLGTRHARSLPKTPTLTWKDDYGTRHPDEVP